MSDKLFGVLLMAYGTPQSLDDIPAYLAHIRGGRAATPEMVASLTARYLAIGGSSPLNSITWAQAQALQANVVAAGQGPCRVFVGMRHAPPYIADVVAEMAASGVKAAVSVVMAPHYSRMAAGAYIEVAQTALADLGNPFRLHCVESWHMEPAFIGALVERVQNALQKLPGKTKQAVLFTAHSLPERIVAAGDPYTTQLAETCAAVAQQAGLAQYQIAYQSAGRTPEPWLGPTAEQALGNLCEQGVHELVVCPVGFVADHLEVLYDIDISLNRMAREIGVHMERTASLNADAQLVAALTNVVLATRHAFFS